MAHLNTIWIITLYIVCRMFSASGEDTNSGDGTLAFVGCKKSSDHAIYSANTKSLNFTELHILEKSPLGISYDRVHHKLYWTEWKSESGQETKKNGYIKMSNPDGTNLVTVLCELENPVGIAVDGESGMMYWASGTNNTIYRARLDGSDIKPIVECQQPKAIALDAVGGRIYWTSTTPKMVSSASINGSGDILNLIQTTSATPRGIVFKRADMTLFYGYGADPSGIIKIDVSSNNTSQSDYNLDDQYNAPNGLAVLNDSILFISHFTGLQKVDFHSNGNASASPIGSGLEVCTSFVSLHHVHVVNDYHIEKADYTIAPSTQCEPPTTQRPTNTPQDATSNPNTARQDVFTSSTKKASTIDGLETLVESLDENDNNINIAAFVTDWDSLILNRLEFDGNATSATFDVFDAYVFDDSELSTQSSEITRSYKDSTYGFEFPEEWKLENGAVVQAAILSSDAIFGDANEISLDIEKDSNHNFFGSRIVSLTLFNSAGQWMRYNFDDPFQIIFELLPSSRDKNESLNCYYFNNIGVWSTEGCNVYATNTSHVTCSCHHMTSFAVLVQLVEIEELPANHEKALTYLTIVCLAISITCLTATIILYGVCSLYKNVRIQIHTNLAVAMMIAQVIFLSGINAEPKNACITVTVLLHYFWMVVFIWMLIEGVHLYLKVSPHVNLTMKILYCMLIAWGIPAPIVAITVGIRVHHYGSNGLCWLPVKHGIIAAFAGPAFLILAVNIIFLVIILVRFCALKTNQDKTDYERAKAGVRAIFILVPLLGIAWIFGMLQFDVASSIIFSYLFAIVNGLQGLTIFITQCLMDDDVKKVLKQKHPRGRVEDSNRTDATN